MYDCQVLGLQDEMPVHASIAPLNSSVLALSDQDASCAGIFVRRACNNEELMRTL